MRLLLAAGLSLLVLSACDRNKTDDTPPPGSDPAMVLGGVDLSKPVKVAGTEPFWNVDITPDGLLYSGVDRPEQRAANPGPQIAGTTATWTTTTDQSLPLIVTLVDTDCSDGMSDRAYPLTARVQIGEETLNGCASSADVPTAPPEPAAPAAPPAPATAEPAATAPAAPAKAE